MALVWESVAFEWDLGRRGVGDGVGRRGARVGTRKT